MGDDAERLIMIEEDGGEFFEDTGPSDPNDLAFDAKYLIHQINEWGDDEYPPSFTELIENLFPKLSAAEVYTVAEGLTLLADQYDYTED